MNNKLGSTEIKEGDLLWKPDEAFKQNANITKYIDWLAKDKELTFDGYHALWQWSVNELEDFWESIWEYFQIDTSTPYEKVLDDKGMPDSRWFTKSKVNYAEHLLNNELTDEVAIYAESETRSDSQVTWGELKKNVKVLATHLRAVGVEPGDRVAAYIPNIPEAITSVLAVTSIGAIWSSCSPDFGVKSVLDRFKQIEPKVLIGIDGYTYGGKRFDRRDELMQLSKGLPTVETSIYIPYLFEHEDDIPMENAIVWDEIDDTVNIDQFQFEDTAFEHPLWILYSSGTTGIPKGIVQSHGGILLEMNKALHFHLNLNEHSNLFFYTTTGWMMFNILVSGLITKSSIVLYDGNPVYPDASSLWKIAERTKTTMFGSSPSFVQIMQKMNVSPKSIIDVSTIEGIILSGSPAGPEVFEWMYKHVKENLWLTSQSGGTDVASGFVGAIPIEPVHAGEIQVRSLGVDVQAFDNEGEALIDEVGELVIRKPMPSMPIYFWNDESNERYLESYFDVYPGVWRHGDFIKITSRGSCVIYGRSDSTLNRHGIRMGTNEIYSCVERIPSIKDSLVVNIDLPNGEFYMPIFVVLQDGITLDDQLGGEINRTIREGCSPRHVPDDVVEVKKIPYTLTNKKMEVPIRRILMGEEETKVANRDAMLNPSSLDFFIEFREEMIK